MDLFTPRAPRCHGFVSHYLQHVQQIQLCNVRKFNLVGGINDGVQLGDLIGYTLERGPSIGHAVQYAAK